MSTSCEYVEYSGQLLDAAFASDMKTVMGHLAAGVGVDTQSRDGVTALMMASVNGHTEVMRALLTTGASMDMQDDVHGQTALMWASGGGHTETVSVLLTAGASVDAPRIEDNATALEMALAEGHRDVVDRLAQALKVSKNEGFCIKNEEISI